MEVTMLVYNGSQYPADRLPEGVDPKGLPTVDEWFAANRTSPEHKAIIEPDTPVRPKRARTK